MNLEQRFRELTSSPADHSFTIAPLPDMDGVFLGADRLGRPALFIESADRDRQPVVRTAHVSLHIGGRFEVANGDNGAVPKTFHALQCESIDPDDRHAFLLLVEAFLAARRSAPSGETLAAFFHALVRMFSVQAARDLAAERQGLWGELFVMSRLRGFQFWAPFWHKDPARRFDFSAVGRRVEVKTALGPERIHHFSHGQLFQAAGEEVVIASLLLRGDDVGLSLRDLIQEARGGFEDAGSLLSLERAVRVAGMHMTDDPGPVFDPLEAERLLCWYWAADAPHFQVPEPAGVSDTRYRVDLSTAATVSPAALAQWLDGWPID